MRTEATIQSLIADLPVSLTGGEASAIISEITEDSRSVVPGGLFIARRGGSHDGRAFISDAVARGAVAVLHDGEDAINHADIAVLRTASVPQIAPVLAERFFGGPSQALTLIGVTGTNGKTTIATLIRDMLNRSGMKCGMMGTVAIDDGAAETPAALTTPPAIEISRTLARMVDNGCKAAAMEVSSHALDQRRVGGLSFDIAVFSNLSGDHLDYHGSLERYADAKALLFESLPETATAVINIDDAAADRMRRGCRARVVGTGLGPHGDFRAEIVHLDSTGSQVRFHPGAPDAIVRIPLVGRHNVSNALQAAAAAQAAGIPLEELIASLEEADAPPGRLEPVRSEGTAGPTVLVDYAHTDDALANVLRAVRHTVPDDARLWVVFGCGGDRDTTKRPRMARIACQLADRIIVTSDNPRTEAPQAIIDQILLGVPRERARDVVEFIDRRHAILHGVVEADERDTVVIAGKGHEDYQVIGQVKVPFDDRIIAAEALRQRAAAARSALT